MPPDSTIRVPIGWNKGYATSCDVVNRPRQATIYRLPCATPLELNMAKASSERAARPVKNNAVLCHTLVARDIRV